MLDPHTQINRHEEVIRIEYEWATRSYSIRA